MFGQAFKRIDDALWKDAGCTSELDYTEQSSWLLFLKYLDALKSDKAMQAALEGRRYHFILEEDYRWKKWAAPQGEDGKIGAPAAQLRAAILERHGVGRGARTRARTRAAGTFNAQRNLHRAGANHPFARDLRARGARSVGRFRVAGVGPGTPATP